jgi:hypothetical protein
VLEQTIEQGARGLISVWTQRCAGQPTVARTTVGISGAGQACGAAVSAGVAGPWFETWLGEADGFTVFRSYSHHIAADLRKRHRSASAAPTLPTRRREELCPAVQGLFANRPVMDVLGIFGRLAQAKVDPGCCQLPVVSVRCRRLEWGIWTQSAG